MNETQISESAGNKRRGTRNDKDSFSIGPDDTVYRYLCQLKKIDSIIGKGAEIVKQLRVDTNAKIGIGETVLDCEDVLSPSAAQVKKRMSLMALKIVFVQLRMLFSEYIYDKIITDDTIDENSKDASQVTVKLLVPSDQMDVLLGKGGQIVLDIRSEMAAQIRILKDKHLPACAFRSDKLV